MPTKLSATRTMRSCTLRSALTRSSAPPDSIPARTHLRHQCMKHHGAGRINLGASLAAQRGSRHERHQRY